MTAPLTYRDKIALHIRYHPHLSDAEIASAIGNPKLVGEVAQMRKLVARPAKPPATVGKAVIAATMAKLAAEGRIEALKELRMSLKLLSRL